MYGIFVVVVISKFVRQRFKHLLTLFIIPYLADVLPIFCLSPSYGKRSAEFEVYLIKGDGGCCCCCSGVAIAEW